MRPKLSACRIYLPVGVVFDGRLAMVEYSINKRSFVIGAAGSGFRDDECLMFEINDAKNAKS